MARRSTLALACTAALACTDPSSETGDEATDGPFDPTFAGDSEDGSSTSEDTDTIETGDDCPPSVPQPPSPDGGSEPFTFGGQSGWSHDAGSPAGWFHTYDAIELGAGFGPDGTPVSAPHKVHLLLPRDYDRCASYPVVVMNDGSSSFWNGGSADKSWDVPGALSSLYAEGSLEPVIVVAVEPNDRDYEYSHTPWTDPDSLEPGDCCGVEDYADYLADGLGAWLDEHYAVATEPEDWAIVGSSRGGLGACTVANLRPDRFGRAACMSPSFWLGLDPVFGGDFDGGPLADSLLIDTLSPTLSDPSVRPHLWIDWGLIRTGGFHNEVIEEAATARGLEMVELLEDEFGYVLDEELHWLEDPEGEHDEVSWGLRFPLVMQTLLGS